MRYKNTKNRKIFNVTKGENKFDAKEDGGTQNGYIKYEINGTAMLVGEMLSNPEKESGIGSLLLFLAVKDAIEQNCGLVQILNAAEDARGFYFHMGCRLDADIADILSNGDFSDEERKKLIARCPIEGQAMTVLNASHTSMFKSWERQG
jgi:hypothetical protein